MACPLDLDLTCLPLFCHSRQHPHIERNERLAWVMLAHDALGEGGRCGRGGGRFLKAVLRVTTEATAGATAEVEGRAPRGGAAAVAGAAAAAARKAAHSGGGGGGGGCCGGAHGGGFLVAFAVALRRRRR